MAVTIAMVRSQIRDLPRPCVRPGRWEPLAGGVADGTTQSFALRYFNAILSSVVIAFGEPAIVPAAPPVYTVQLASDPQNGWTVAPDPVSQAPTVSFVNAPPPGTLIGAQYLVTAFSDFELTNYLGQNVRSTDGLTLKATHAALIPVMLSDRNLSMLFRIGDRTDDPSQWQRTQLALLKMLNDELNSEPGADPEGGSSCGSGYGYGGPIGNGVGGYNG